jgi:membrane-associated phospholipid phosphatase
MPAWESVGQSSHYFSQLFALVQRSVTRLVRPPSHPQRAEAARRLARQASLLTVVLGAAVVVLMVAVDVTEIGLMPPRGTPSLWPVRILTDFGKAANVLWSLAIMLVAIALAIPALRGSWRFRLLGLGTRLQFMFFAVLVPVLAGEVIKWIVGRGRPFVGGHANAFNFSPLAATNAYASFPSAHAITAFALAFALSALWPRARLAFLLYAVLIAGSRLVLLAHHPSDVVVGALIGVIGAMVVRYWFAARGVGFAIARDGAIVPLAGPGSAELKGVARGAAAP